MGPIVLFSTLSDLSIAYTAQYNDGVWLVTLQNGDTFSHVGNSYGAFDVSGGRHTMRFEMVDNRLFLKGKVGDMFVSVLDVELDPAIVDFDSVLITIGTIGPPNSTSDPRELIVDNFNVE